MSTTYEKPPKDQRERALTKEETSGDFERLTVYSWNKARDMGIDKRENLEELGWTHVKDLDKAGDKCIMQIEKSKLVELRRNAYKETFGYYPGEGLVYGKNGNVDIETKKDKVSGWDVKANANQPPNVDE